MTNSSALLEKRVGDIVTEYPQAADVFRRHKVDFCCGGHIPLAEALQAAGTPESTVLEELNRALEETPSEEGTPDFTRLSSEQLIQHILTTHHSYLARELPAISEYSLTVLRAHGANHPELFKVHELYHALRAEIEQHLIKEEELLFPGMKEENANIGQLIKDTESEHDGAGDILKELARLTKDYKVPDDGCPTYQVFYTKLEQLQSDMYQHIHLENNILFPRFK